MTTPTTVLAFSPVGRGWQISAPKIHINRVLYTDQTITLDAAVSAELRALWVQNGTAGVIGSDPTPQAAERRISDRYKGVTLTYEQGRRILPQWAARIAFTMLESDQVTLHRTRRGFG